MLRDGCDIVTGTAGRLVEMAESGKLLLATIRFVVLDEADALTDKDNLDMVMKLWRRVPKDGTVQVCVLECAQCVMATSCVYAGVISYPHRDAVFL